ncbi:MAG: glutathione S-transferase family protein [Deltaproteobacteria bacterium]|nr:glutathione S-transferase family protein [Deltaproteobacteria bacterium]
MMVLHGTDASPFTRKVRAVLAFKGISYEDAELFPVPKTPELLRMNPLGKIPVLRDGTVTVADSSVICAYLERVRPEPAIYPQAPASYARALFLEEYADTEMAAVVGGLLIERYLAVRLFKRSVDEERVRRLLEQELPKALDYVEFQLAPPGDWLVEGRFTVADAAVGTLLVTLRVVGVDVDPTRWPQVHRYAATVGRCAWFTDAAGTFGSEEVAP